MGDDVFGKSRGYSVRQGLENRQVRCIYVDLAVAVCGQLVGDFVKYLLWNICKALYLANG